MKIKIWWALDGHIIGRSANRPGSNSAYPYITSTPSIKSIQQKLDEKSKKITPPPEMGPFRGGGEILRNHLRHLCFSMKFFYFGPPLLLYKENVILSKYFGNYLILVLGRDPYFFKKKKMVSYFWKYLTFFKTVNNSTKFCTLVPLTII